MNGHPSQTTLSLTPSQVDRMADSLNVLATSLALRLSDVEIARMRAIAKTIVFDRRPPNAAERAELLAIWQRHDDKVYGHQLNALRQLGVEFCACGCAPVAT